jgi:hypothetical protein
VYQTVQQEFLHISVRYGCNWALNSLVVKDKGDKSQLKNTGSIIATAKKQ